ncbi:MAG: cold shock domain-containing protein CspD [Pseudomonadales bacterium]
MQKGVVKWFNNAKGYGFILPEDDNGDIFAHYSAIEMDGYKTLKAGQRVSFETEEGPKGLHAVNIQSAEENTEPKATAQSSQDSVEQSEDQLEEMA